MTRVVFMGTPEFAVPSLVALLREGYDIVGVLTQPDRRAGRGRKLIASPVKRLAQQHSLTIQQPHTLRDPDAQANLAALTPDVIVVAAYGLILPRAVLDLPSHGCVNVHGSLLPRHRGAAPIAAAILAGDQEAGVSIMLMDAGVDTGPVLSTASLPIAPEDTTGTLTGKLATLGADLLMETLPRWLGDEITPRPQPAAGATYADRIDKRAGEIDWSEPAVLIERRVRAYQPWPTAYTFWNGHRLKILRARAEEIQETREQGLVIAGKVGEVGVVTGTGVLWLKEVQLAGKRPLPSEAFLRGATGFVGSVLRGCGQETLPN